MIRTTASLIAALLCASCNDPGIEASQSLVGASELPAAEALARETLYITSGGSDSGGDVLSYELRPNNSLTVTHTYSDDRRPGQVDKGKETLDISPDVAAKVKQLLWRVRPAELEGLEHWPARPLGCERKGPHDFGEVAVAFINEGSSGTEDDQVGIFELPYSDSCNTGPAMEARRVVLHVLQLLPKSEVAAEFERSR